MCIGKAGLKRHKCRAPQIWPFLPARQSAIQYRRTGPGRHFELFTMAKVKNYAKTGGTRAVQLCAKDV
jgi:hypothetical protein